VASTTSANRLTGASIKVGGAHDSRYIPIIGGVVRRRRRGSGRAELRLPYQARPRRDRAWIGRTRPNREAGEEWNGLIGASSDGRDRGARKDPVDLPVDFGWRR